MPNLVRLFKIGSCGFKKRHIPVFHFLHYQIQTRCDQIGRFIVLWATFQSRLQQLFCPNCLHFQAIFEKVSKYFIFLWNHIWATFIDIWRLFTGHSAVNNRSLLVACYYLDTNPGHRLCHNRCPDSISKFQSLQQCHCDQIGRFVKVIGNKFPYKSSQNYYLKQTCRNISHTVRVFVCSQWPKDLVNT